MSLILRLVLSLAVVAGPSSAFQSRCQPTGGITFRLLPATVLRASDNDNNSGGLFGFMKSKPQEETDGEIIRNDSGLSSQESSLPSTTTPPATATTTTISEEDAAKFGFGARIESLKCVVVGAVAGGLSLTPAALIRDTLLTEQANSIAQWEFDTDTGSLQAALFAIVYRYCIREDTNPQLKDGVTGAFVLTRTLARLQVPSYCSAIPLDCTYSYYILWKCIYSIVTECCCTHTHVLD